MPVDSKAASASSSASSTAASSAADTRAAAERDKALGLVLNHIERNFGKGSIMRLGDASRMRVETFPTGALTLDLALGGGYPKECMSIHFIWDEVRAKLVIGYFGQHLPTSEDK